MERSLEKLKDAIENDKECKCYSKGQSFCY